MPERKTPAQAAFDAELQARLAARAALLLGAEQAVLAELAGVRGHIQELLARQPADWQRWPLQQLLEQIRAALEGATGRSAASTDAALRQAWQQGEDLVDKPLGAAGLRVEMQLPVLDVALLAQLRQFTALRLKDVGQEAATRIGRELSLVTIGAQTPFAAIRAVQAALGNETAQRATTVVRTEVSRAYALAQDARLQQAAALVPGLGKQWRRSGKIHSRWNHDAIDGQVRPAKGRFELPSAQGVVRLRHPHDPAAPVAETINCGCVARPYLAQFAADGLLANPGAKPFSEQELRLDHRKGMLDQAARRAGLRGGLGAES